MGGVCGEIAAKGASIAIVVICRVHKGSLGANTDAVLVFVGAIVVWLWRGIASIGRYRSPRSGGGALVWWFRFELSEL
jgi:hypothetical protein